MTTECTATSLEFHGLKRREVKGHFDGGEISSDGGGVLLREPLKLPPFAITTMVPLVTLDEKIGTTGVKKSSHLLSQPDSRELPDQLPMMPRSSCFLMDLRLSHRGLANKTDRVRPIMNMVCQRYWFADSRNFEKHPPLRVSASEYKRIPKENRRLFDWGTQPGPQVKR